MPNIQIYSRLNNRIKDARRFHDRNQAIQEFENIKIEINKNIDDLGESDTKELLSSANAEIMSREEANWAELRNSSNKTDLDEMTAVLNEAQYLADKYPDVEKYQSAVIHVEEIVKKIKENTSSS